MEQHQIIPDVIDKVPPAVLEVTYEGGLKVNLGKELTPTQVKDQPEVKWQADPSKYFTLLMVDPDAPSRQDPKIREVNHWLVVNVPGRDISKGDVITGYLGSGPFKDTGLHRYIFLLFEQVNKLDFDEPKTGNMSRAHRFNFTTRKFAKKYNLGDPISGNFFQAQWDPYCDERRKNITND